MPKIKQPERLENIALNQSLTWICDVGEQLMPVIGTANELDQIAVAMKALWTIFDKNVSYTLFDLMCMKLGTKIENFIEKLRKNINTGEPMSKYLSQVNIAVSLSEILLSRKLKRLRFEDMPIVFGNFFNKLEALNGLEHLSLGAMSGGWRTFDMEAVILKGIKPMTNLKSFTLHYDCTDKILNLLVENCPKLQFVDFTNSKNITDKSIEILVKIKNLRVALLQKTQISIEGIIQLLLKSKNLLDLAKCDDLGQCLEFIDINHPEITSFKLKKLDTKLLTTRQIEILSKKFPDMMNVSLVHNHLLTDLMALTGLKQLEELKVTSCHFLGDKLWNLLDKMGHNLKVLELDHVEMIDLSCISEKCPNLRDFTLCDCTLSLTSYILNLTVSPFYNLEKLVFMSESLTQHLEFIVTTAVNLKFLAIGSKIHTTDEFWDRILASNSLKYLETMKIMNSEQLTIQTAHKLISKCQNLSRLSELRFWKQVTKEQIAELKNVIQEKNYDLFISNR